MAQNLYPTNDPQQLRELASAAVRRERNQQLPQWRLLPANLFLR